jgi:hypothetical protein
MGDGAGTSITVVQADDHTQVLAAQVGVVASAHIGRIRTYCLGDQHPTGLALAHHERLGTPVVHAKDVRRIRVGHRPPPSTVIKAIETFNNAIIH